MNIKIDLNMILQALMIFGLVGGIRGIYSRFADLNKKVDTINGGLKEVKVWKTEHTKLDEQNHDTAKEDRRDIWDAISNLRNKE